MASPEMHEVSLRRFDTGQPWGFKMQGGADVGGPLHVVHVHPKGISGQAGLKQGDILLAICGADCRKYSHQQAKGEMLRCGNDVDLTVQRGGAPVQQAAAPIQPAQAPRVQMDTSSINPHMNPEGKFRDVKPKTYQVMEEEEKQAAAGARPASIFDKRKQERSAYTQAAGSGYQQAFGQGK